MRGACRAACSRSGFGTCTWQSSPMLLTTSRSFATTCRKCLSRGRDAPLRFVRAWTLRSGRKRNGPQSERPGFLRSRPRKRASTRKHRVRDRSVAPKYRSEFSSNTMSDRTWRPNPWPPRSSARTEAVRLWRCSKPQWPLNRVTSPRASAALSGFRVLGRLALAHRDRGDIPKAEAVEDSTATIARSRGPRPPTGRAARGSEPSLIKRQKTPPASSHAARPDNRATLRACCSFWWCCPSLLGRGASCAITGTKTASRACPGIPRGAGLSDSQAR